jgi:hypothetical protein
LKELKPKLIENTRGIKFKLFDSWWRIMANNSSGSLRQDEAQLKPTITENAPFPIPLKN